MKKRKTLFISSLISLLTIASCGLNNSSSSFSSDDTSFTSEFTSDTSSSESTSDISLTSDTSDSSDYSSSEDSSNTSEEIPEAKQIKGYIHDDHKLLFSNPLMKKENDTIFEEVTDSYVDNGVTYWIFYNKSTIKLRLSDNEGFIASGVTIDETYTYSIDSEGFVSFVIDTEDDFISITTLYHGSGIPLYSIRSENLVPKFYTSDKTTKINECGPNDKVYVKINGVTEDITVKTLTLTYTPGTDAVASTINKDITDTLDSDGFYSFTGIESQYGMTVTVKEYNANRFKDSEFVGDYVVFDKSSASPNHSYKALADRQLKVDKTGQVFYGNDEEVFGIIESEIDGGLLLDTNAKVLFGEDILICRNNNYGKMDTPLATTFGYEMICLKKQNQNDLLSDYSVRAEYFKTDTKLLLVVEFSRNNISYKTIAIDFNLKKVYYHPEFNYIYGSHFYDDRVIYELKQDDTLIAKITYSNEGGINDRYDASYPVGAYEGTLGKLIIPNINSALLNEEIYAWSIQEDVVTLRNSSKKYTLKLVSEKQEYDVLKEEDITSTIPSFRGLKFVGNIMNSYYNQMNEIDLLFNKYTSDDKITGSLLHGVGSSAVYRFGFTATYDCTLNVLNCSITSENYSMGEVGKTFSFTCETGKLTARTGFDERLFNLLYNKVGCEFICDKFVM